MRLTRKWSFVAQEATRLAALGLSPLEISKRLDVSKSSVTRWMAAGKLQRTVAKPPTHPSVLVKADGKSPEEWSKAVRSAYDLDATDDQLVILAESALALSLDPRVAPAVRMTAAGRYQSLVRQLALVARRQPEEVEPVPTPAPPAKPQHPVRRRTGSDPRNGLMVVK